MNVLYIHTHDSGRYIGPYGYQNLSPNINSLGRESVVFRHCYCAGPTCSPSRSALLTGTWPHCNGMLGLAHRGFSLYDYQKHAANVFASNGYETILCGIQHEAVDPANLGYQIVENQQKNTLNTEEYDLASTDAMCRYFVTRDSQKPFFASLGFISCHRDFPPVTVEADYIAPAPPLYDCARNREDMAGYLSSVKIADQCVGRILAVLKQQHLLDDTIILFTTDHGIAFPYMKCSLYDTGIGVACMLYYPDNPMRGKALDALVSHLDLLPTIYELCGIEKPAWLQGKTLLPILNGEEQEINDAIFAEVTYHASYEPMRCIRTTRHKLIRRFDIHNRLVPSNIDKGLSKEFLLDAGILEKTVQPREMLFDLFLDPLERENLVSYAAYKEIYQDLSQRLTRWMADTQDPVLISVPRVHAPQGAKINKLTCLHPGMTDFEHEEI